MMFPHSFQILGSASSQDMDVMVFVQEIPDSIQECSTLCQSFANLLSEKLTTAKKINTNLGILKNGVLIQVYKGITDETNNALYCTYPLHKQYFDNHILNTLTRDKEQKIQRTLRIVLSFLTKTNYRAKIKEALRSDWKKKIEISIQIDMGAIINSEDFTLGNHVTMIEFQKTIAFQLGQSIALLEGKELYTKEEIGDYFPELGDYLFRKTGLTNEMLATFIERFLALAQNYQ